MFDRTDNIQQRVAPDAGDQARGLPEGQVQQTDGEEEFDINQFIPRGAEIPTIHRIAKRICRKAGIDAEHDFIRQVAVEATLMLTDPEYEKRMEREERAMELAEQLAREDPELLRLVAAKAKRLLEGEAA